VSTSKCQIINWSPFDEQVISLYKNRSGEVIDCKIKKEFDISIKRYNFTGIQIENKSNAKLECFSSSVKRKDEEDDSVHYSPSVQFNGSVNYFPEDIAVKISCMINKGIEMS